MSNASSEEEQAWDLIETVAVENSKQSDLLPEICFSTVC